jgi:hypothetical protein
MSSVSSETFNIAGATACCGRSRDARHKAGVHAEARPQQWGGVNRDRELSQFCDRTGAAM